MGIRRDRQEHWVAQGHRGAFYVRPPGTARHPHFMRRPAERPANLRGSCEAATFRA